MRSIVGLALLVLLTSLWSPASAMGAMQPASISHDAAAYGYDAGANTYDAPARLSPPDTVATAARGPRAGPEVASWEGPASTRGCCVAAKTVPDILRVGDVKLAAVPKGSVGVPAQTGKGLEYAIPRGTPEISEKVASIRIMDPVTTGKYQYPNGYAVYMNSSGQTINPLTGQTIANSNPFAHIPLP